MEFMYLSYFSLPRIVIALRIPAPTPFVATTRSLLLIAFELWALFDGGLASFEIQVEWTLGLGVDRVAACKLGLEFTAHLRFVVK
jgi:hypothetical protein